MRKLISKLQFNVSETGEFTDIAERSFEETVQVIKEFPWEEQHKHLVISLTNPSVTIEGADAGFLKLSLYYNNKFVLYYLDKNRNLFTRTFITLDEAFPVIEQFFSHPDFQPDGFHKENTWMKNSLVHFVTNDFRYIISQQSCMRFLRRTTLFNLAVFLVFFITTIFLRDGSQKTEITRDILILFFFLLVGGGLNLLLFFNYLFYAAGLVCIVSKGNPVFIFGKEQTERTYQKKDIVKIQVRRTVNTRSPIRDFAIIDIIFKTGESIRFPSLLIGVDILLSKMQGIETEEINAFPFLLR